jgi:hypothetical protein
MHYSCAFWHGIDYKLGTFSKIENLKFQKLIGKKCSICGLNEGCCVRCYEWNCSEYFHVECA